MRRSKFGLQKHSPNSARRKLPVSFTLGIRNTAVWYSSRKCASRREHSSHKTAASQSFRCRRKLIQGCVWIGLPYPLKSPMEAQVQVDYEPQLEEAAFLRLASNPGLSLLRWLSTAFCPSTSYQTSAGTVGNRQEGRGTEIGFILGSCRSREAPRLHLPCHGARCRIASMQKLPSSPYLRTDA